MSDIQSQVIVTVDEAQGVATITLNRPEKRNALSASMMEDLATAYERLGANAHVRVVIVQGAGAAFCAGADRKSYPGELSEGPLRGDRHAALQVGERLVRAIRGCSAITVARLHGHVVGGGMVIALACDVRVCDESSVFSLPETAFGLPLAWSATPLVIDEVGPLVARELILFGRVFTAAEGFSRGFLNAVVSDDQLDEAVDAYVRSVRDRDHAATVMSKVQFAALAKGRAQGDITAFDSLLLHYSTQQDAVRQAFGAESLNVRGATSALGARKESPHD